MKNELAIRYGNGLFLVAKEKQIIAEVLKSTEFLIKIMQNNESFLFILRAIRISKEEKHNFINRLFKDKINLYLLNLIYLMIDRKREDYLQNALHAYEELAYDALKIAKATVFSVHLLNDKQVEQIKHKLENDTGYKIILENKIDTKLIAGIKVCIANQVLDFSTQKQLYQLRMALLKGVRNE